jgi:flagella basal body P-ring formation protein FlgA
MKRFLFPLLGLAVLLAATPDTPAAAQQGTALDQTAFAAPLRLKSAVLVEDSVVRLGDLFDGLGEKAATAIARAPAPGSRVRLDARWLQSLARTHALPWRPDSAFENVTIERASQVVDGSRIEELLVPALAQRGVDGNVSLLLDNPEMRLHLPVDSEATLALTALSLDPVSGRFTAQIAAPAEGPALVRAAVTGRAVRMLEVPVLTRRMTSDGVIGPNDIEWVTLRIDRIGQNVITDPEILIGKSPRRSIRAGQVVRANELREPLVVAKNSLVTIRLTTPRMVLSAQGRALEDGEVASVIRVMNTQSNTVINAVVVDPSLVEVTHSTVLSAN